MDKFQVRPNNTDHLNLVIPGPSPASSAMEPGIHFDLASKAPWIPAFAGMTIKSKAFRSRDWLELQRSKIVTQWRKAR